MNKKISIHPTITILLKLLLLAYLVTAILLLLLALFLYRFQLGETVVSISIILIYIVTCFLSGLLMGKKMGTRKFLWGLLAGSLYFLILLLISLVVNHGVSGIASHFFTVLLLCGGSGMLGGMLG